jgi:hypothetical protein
VKKHRAGVARRSLTASVLCSIAFVLVAAAPATKAAGRVGVSRQKDVATSSHFGDYYAPELVSAGRKLIAFYRTNEQRFNERMFAISKNGGKTFSKAKKLRLIYMTQIAAITADAEGNIYFAGPTADSRKFTIVRSDPKVKVFTLGAVIDAEHDVGKLSIRFGTDGRLFVAWQTGFPVGFPQGTFPFDRVTWAVSSDKGITFSEPTNTNANTGLDSDFGPSISASSSGAVWLMFIREATLARQPAPELFTSGRIVGRRIDGGADEQVECPRAATPAGRATEVLAACAEDGSLRVSWGEKTYSPTVMSVFFARATPGLPVDTPAEPLAVVGTPHEHHLARTASGHVFVFLHGAHFDSQSDEPAIVALASDDDGLTFGPPTQITTFPPQTSFDVKSDGTRVYGLWTDTRLVTFASFEVANSK